MKRLVTSISIILLIHFGHKTYAQTFNFSQFHAVPLALNPAMTGDFKSTFRLSGNYRSQWVFGGTPYLTGSVGAEFRLLTNKLDNDRQKLGIGFNIITDKSNDGALKFTDFSFSSAYHIGIDEDGAESFGIGLQGTFHQRMINLSALTFEDQFTSFGFINTLPTGEYFSSLNKSYIDANVGVLYKKQFTDEAGDFYIGASAYNLRQPNVSLTPLNYFQLPTRFTGHFGGSFYLSESLDIKYSGVYMRMAGAQNFTLGAALDNYMDKDFNKNILLGLWYRIGDALIPYVGFKTNNLQIGMSYDATVSSLKTVSQTKNAFELSIIYSPNNLLTASKPKKQSVFWY